MTRAIPLSQLLHYKIRRLESLCLRPEQSVDLGGPRRSRR